MPFDEDESFKRKKPFDEFAMDTIQDSFERRLDKVIKDRDKKPEISVRSEISNLVCTNKKNKRGYFNK